MSAKVLSHDELNQIKSNIVFGLERIEPHLDELECISIPIADPFKYRSDGPSVIWLVERLSSVFPRIVEHYKKTLDLKRILIYVLDEKDFVQVIKNPNYFRIFIDPRVRFVLFDEKKALDIEIVHQAFAPTPEDNPKDTRFFFHFESNQYDQEKIKNKLLAIHESMHVNFGEMNYLAWGVNTYDRFRGFAHHVKNLSAIVKNPDIRRLQNVLKDYPAIIIGAGPSVHQQYDFLKELQGRAVFIAADTMLKPLSDAGIKADIITSIERDEAIISLLDDPRDHSETLLVGLSVLHPDCYKKYRGPVSPLDSYYGFQKWIGMPRSKMGIGHSCVGLAMGLASYLGCQNVFLAGIDLCWSKEGESHSKSVRYLEDESYKQQYEILRKQAFIKLNNQGEEVQTHTYWSLFQKQFEEWIKAHPGTVYNLSPEGVKLDGASYVSLDEAKKIGFIKNKENIFKKIREAQAYDGTPSAKSALLHFKEKASRLLKDIPKFKEALFTKNKREILATFKSHPDYPLLLHSIYDGDFKRYQELEDYQVEEIEKISQDLNPYLDELKEILETGIQNVEDLLEDHKKTGCTLF